MTQNILRILHSWTSYALLIGMVLTSANRGLAQSPDAQENSKKYFETYLKEMNDYEVAKARTSSSGRAPDLLQMTFEFTDLPKNPIVLTSRDAQSFHLRLDSSLANSVGQTYVETFIKDFYLLSRTSNSRLSVKQLRAFAYDAQQGDLRSQVLILNDQLGLFETAEATVKGSSFYSEWLELKNKIQTNYQETLQAATTQYNRDSTVYRARMQNWSDDQIRKKMWQLMIESNRPGLVEFFKTVLPWELMRPSDKVVWKAMLSGLLDKNPSNNSMYYRGEPGRFIENAPGEKTKGFLGRMFISEEQKSLRMAWPIRNFLAGDMSFQELAGVTPPAGVHQYQEEFSKVSFFHDLLYRRTVHSYGKYDGKTLRSPFISTSQIYSQTRQFVLGQKSDKKGVQTGWLLSDKRAVVPDISFKSETETLAPLFLLPDELVFEKDVHSGNFDKSAQEEAENVEQRLVREGRLTQEKAQTALVKPLNMEDLLKSSQVPANSAGRSAALQCEGALYFAP